MNNISLFAVIAGASLLLSSCDTFVAPHGYENHHHGYGNRGYRSGIHSVRCDHAGVPIYGYENGRPVYGNTQVGRPVHALNQLYAGCYVPSWGRSSTHAYPHGVRFSSNPPRLYDNSNIEAGDAAPRYARYY